MRDVEAMAIDPEMWRLSSLAHILLATPPAGYYINNIGEFAGGGEIYFKHSAGGVASELISGHQYWTRFTTSSSARRVGRWLMTGNSQRCLYQEVP